MKDQKRVLVIENWTFVANIAIGRIFISNKHEKVFPNIFNSSRGGSSLNSVARQVNLTTRYMYLVGYYAYIRAYVKRTQLCIKMLIGQWAIIVSLIYIILIIR